MNKRTSLILITLINLFILDHSIAHQPLYSKLTSKSRIQSASPKKLYQYKKQTPSKRKLPAKASPYDKQYPLHLKRVPFVND